MKEGCICLPFWILMECQKPTGGLSRYLVGRVLNGHYPRDVYKVFDITNAMDVDFEWFMVGSAGQYHPRTLRIHLQQVKHFSKQSTDQMLRLPVWVCARP